MYLLSATGDIIVLGTMAVIMVGGFAAIIAIALKGTGIIK